MSIGDCCAFVRESFQLHTNFDGAAEGFYHGMVLGLVASLSSKYYIHSNREAGEGRFDLQLEPKAKELPGILMELKAVSSSEKDKLSELAEEALVQTEEKYYQRDLEDRGISDIVRYGIAFSGKNVEITGSALLPAFLNRGFR